MSPTLEPLPENSLCNATFISTLGLNPEPFAANPAPADFGRYIGSQTPVGEQRPGRVMQFALRYHF